MGFVFDNTENDEILDRMLSMADAIDGKVGTYACDLHDELFNEDPPFIYGSQAEAACDSVGTWSAIRLVVKYEQDNFGAVSTDIAPNTIANMCVYIYGMFFLNQSTHLQRKWDSKLTKRDINKIKKELQHFLDEGVTSRTFDGMVWDEYGTY